MDKEERTLWTTVAVMIMALVFCFFLFRVIIFIKNFVFIDRCSIPTVNCNISLFCFLTLLSVYKQSLSGIPSLCLLLQAGKGFCSIFSKDRIFCLYIFTKPFILFYKPETVQVVLNSTKLIDKSKEYELLTPWLGEGLITSTGAKWRKSRKLLTPTFHFSVMEEFIPVFQEQSNVLVSKLQSLVQEPWVDIVPLTSACTLDIICQTAMGVSVDAQGQRDCKYSRAIHEIGEAFLHRTLQPWLYPNFIFNCTAYGRRFNANIRFVHELTRRVIKNKKLEMVMRRRYRDIEKLQNDGCSEKKKRKAFLELLLEQHLNDPSFTEENVREEVDTFMFAGHDTTSMLVSWTLYCLGQNPEIQQRVQDELDNIFEDDINRYIIREDLTKMKYLECVIKETLRLYPSVPFISRECKESFTVLDHTVPSGSLCVIPIFVLHLNPESFPEPEKFLPERFFPENSEGRHPYAFVPFSAGPRNCIGQKFAMMEEKVILANILKKFRVHSLDPRDKVLTIPSLTTNNVKPLRLRFEPRNL